MSISPKYQSIIISPSGHFYGSEQVLFDYISASKISHIVMVKGKGILYKKLKSLEHIASFSFHSILLLYLKIYLRCLVSNIHSVYLNEAGHIRYFQILAKLFPKVKFVIHVRILEDTSNSRWVHKLKSNVEVFSISEFMQKRLTVKSKLLYDPYRFNQLVNNRTSPEKFLHVGILGRITNSKGIYDISSLMHLIQHHHGEQMFIFHFYGSFSEDALAAQEELTKFNNVFLEKFIENKDDIFSNIHCVLHAAVNEPLGRVFLDAINYQVPFVGINSGGIGEIAQKVDLTAMLVEADSVNVHLLLYKKLLNVAENYTTYIEKMILAKMKAESIFSLSEYVKTIDAVLS